MKHYYLNLDTTKNPGANNEVHVSTCPECPADERIDLGWWNNGIEAVEKAKQMGFQKADGCAICCKEAHKE